MKGERYRTRTNQNQSSICAKRTKNKKVLCFICADLWFCDASCLSSADLRHCGILCGSIACHVINVEITLQKEEKVIIAATPKRLNRRILPNPHTRVSTNNKQKQALQRQNRALISTTIDIDVRVVVIQNESEKRQRAFRLSKAHANEQT